MSSSGTPELHRTGDILVIGYGNSIRGDDALGQVVAEEIERQLSDDTVRVLTEEILTTELVAELADVKLAIFLDASTEGTVGQVACCRVEPDLDSAASMAHTLTVEALLAFTQQFYERAPETYLLTSRGVTFELQDVQLSPPVAAVVPVMVETALALIRRTQDDRPQNASGSNRGPTPSCIRRSCS